MGLIESLTKLVDPIAAHAREEEMKVVRETPERNETSAPPEFACRICGHRSADGHFCPTCLAGTMGRVPAGR
jgi:rubrerythrin